MQRGLNLRVASLTPAAGIPKAKKHNQGTHKLKTWMTRTPASSSGFRHSSVPVDFLLSFITQTYDVSHTLLADLHVLPYKKMLLNPCSFLSYIRDNPLNPCTNPDEPFWRRAYRHSSLAVFLQTEWKWARYVYAQPPKNSDMDGSDGMGYWMDELRLT